MWEPGFGSIELTNFDGTDTRTVRIGAMDLDYVHQQEFHDSLKKEEPKGCHIRTDDVFCSTSFLVQETPAQVVAKIQKHDKENSRYVRDFAARNGFLLVKGEAW